MSIGTIDTFEEHQKINIIDINYQERYQMSGLQKQFGARVKELRKKKGYTQEHLAEILGIGVRSLGKIETGNSFPSTETLENLIRALNVSTVEIFDFEHLQPTENLKDLTIQMIDSNPDKISDIYKIVKAITS